MAKKKKPAAKDHPDPDSQILRFPQPGGGRQGAVVKMLDEALESHTDPIDLCQMLYEAMDDPGRELAERLLSETDPDRLFLVQTVLTEVFTAGEVPDFAYEHYLDGAAPVLRAAMADRARPDRVRVLAARICNLFDPGSMPPELMGEMARADEALRDHAVAGMAKILLPDPVGLNHFFMALGAIDEEDDDSRLAIDDESAADWLEKISSLAGDLTDGVSAAVTTIIAAMVCHELDPEPALRALDALRQYPTPVSAWFLRELAALPAMGPVGFKAGAYAASMAREGVEPHYDNGRVFKKGQVSMLDGDGSCSLTLLFYNSQTNCRECLALLLNDQLGLKDTWFVPQDGQRVMKAFKDQTPDIVQYDCSLELARRFYGNALAIHKRNKQPMWGEMLMGRSYLGFEPVEPAALLPDLSAYEIDETSWRPDWVRTSDRLVQVPLGRHAQFCTTHAYNFIMNEVPKRGRGRLNDEKQRVFIEQIVPMELPAILARLAHNLYLEALAGRAGTSDNQIAAHTWYALTNRKMALEEIPYIKAVLDHSIPCLVQNTRMGFTSQAEANAASLEKDSGFDDDMGPEDIIQAMISMLNKTDKRRR